MIAHCNRWLLAFAAAYLALLPTNVATFAQSFAYGGSIVFALCVLGLARGTRDAVPPPPRSVALALAAWALWSMASLAWSIDPGYSEDQLEREVADSLVVMLVFYVAARDAASFRVLTGAALASLAVLGLAAIGVDLATDGWDAGRWHHGVGPWSTWTVLVTPLLFGLVAPPPLGFGDGVRSRVLGLALVAVVVVTDRMTDNRIVWLALAGTLAAASLAAALRWPHTFTRTPMRWVATLVALLLVLGVAFIDAARERAGVVAPAAVTQSLERDPRIVLWEHVRDKIEARPWIGYGFGRRVLADQLSKELGNPLLAHAHNLFASQWLQTGLIGMLAFAAVLAALFARYVRFIRARDDALAFAGVVGIALIVGLVLKNLTDDFLFRSNAKEFWALAAMVLGFGVRREAEAAARVQRDEAAPREAHAAARREVQPAAAQPVQAAARRDGDVSGCRSGAADAAAPVAPPPAAAPRESAPPGPRPGARTPESTP